MGIHNLENTPDQYIIIFLLFLGFAAFTHGGIPQFNLPISQ
jgi:hypothetical protein